MAKGKAERAEESALLELRLFIEKAVGEGTNDAKAMMLLMASCGMFRLAFNQKDAAKMLGMSVSKLRLETMAGKIRRTPIGLYAVAEMMRYLREEESDEYLRRGRLVTS